VLNNRYWSAVGGALVTVAFAFATSSVLAEDEVIACAIIRTTGDFENLEPNFRANADRAEFTFLAPMRAVAENILLYAEEQGGELIMGYAALKGVLFRESTGAIAMDQLQILWPHTIIKQNGQYYSIIAVAHEKAMPIGLVMGSGGNPLGEMELRPGEFDPNSPMLGFNHDTSSTIHNKLLENEGFSARLMAAGETFSTIEPDTARYSSFITGTLLPAMEEARRQDETSPCSIANPMETLESIQF
jgi:hypothetical protein